MGVEELVCFGFEPVLGGGEVVDGLGPLNEAPVEGGFDLLVCLLGDEDALVAVGDELFGDAYGHGLPRAAGAFSGSAGADVVGVADALFVTGVVELQPRVAGAAVQDALQAVVVFAAAFSGGGTALQKGLDLLPDLGVGDGLVGTRVQSTLVADLPDVLGVAQQLEERGTPHRPRGTLRDRERGHSSRGGFGGEVAGVEPRNRRHDAVKQHAGGGFVDVLDSGDQVDASVDEVTVDVDVFEPVAGQPVNLVHDAVGQFVLFDVFDHAHQVGPVGGLG